MSFASDWSRSRFSRRLARGQITLKRSKCRCSSRSRCFGVESATRSVRALQIALDGIAPAGPTTSVARELLGARGTPTCLLGNSVMAWGMFEKGWLEFGAVVPLHGLEDNPPFIALMEPECQIAVLLLPGPLSYLHIAVLWVR